MHTSLIFVFFLGLFGCANGCPTGWKKFGEKCYINVEKKMSQKDAQANCNKLGGFLAEPTSAAENKAISELSTTISNRIIGIVDKKKENTFVGETSNKVITYSNWYKPTREPNNAGNEDCVEIDFRTRGSWNDLPCTYPKPSVCQKNICPDNSKPFGSMCYTISSETATWCEAQARCKSKGGALAEPRTAALNNFISGLTSSRFWIGLSDIATEGTYQWNSDGAKLGSFKPWDSRQPDDWKDNEDCIENNHGGRRAKWNDRACSDKFRYACQIKQE